MGDNDGLTPVLIYDGDCGFCRCWVRYWERLTGFRVRCEKYQAVANRYPDISLEEFARSIQFIDSDGTRYYVQSRCNRTDVKLPHSLWRLTVCVPSASARKWH